MISLAGSFSQFSFKSYKQCYSPNFPPSLNVCIPSDLINRLFLFPWWISQYSASPSSNCIYTYWLLILNECLLKQWLSTGDKFALTGNWQCLEIFWLSQISGDTLLASSRQSSGMAVKYLIMHRTAPHSKSYAFPNVYWLLRSPVWEDTSFFNIIALIFL